MKPVPATDFKISMMIVHIVHGAPTTRLGQSVMQMVGIDQFNQSKPIQKL